MKAMEKTSNLGRLSPTGFVGSGFRFARYRPTPDGGLHIVMVTNRPMSFGELYRGGRSTDYQFGIVVLNVDKNSKGVELIRSLKYITPLYFTSGKVQRGYGLLDGDCKCR